MSGLLRRPEPGRPRATSALAWALAVCGASACSSPARLAFSDGELVAAANARNSIDDVTHALQLADLGPLRLRVPTELSELRPDLDEFWHASAYAWNPQLRALRRRVRELREASRSAGKPGPIQTQTMLLDPSDPSREVELIAMVDVLALVGVGPSVAARELAAAQTRAALGQLEARAWSLRFEVDRARVELAAAKSLETALGGLYADCEQLVPRVEILTQRGWIAPGMSASALAALHMVEHRQTMARADVARMQRELADLCGLDVAHPAFDALANGVIDRFRPEEVEFAAPSTEQLLENLPELRAMKLELAMAEAELQSEARMRWPMVGLGPRLISMPDEFLVGPMLGVDVPFPGSLDGRIAAARERRDSAYEQLEGALVMARSRVTAAQRVYEQTLLLRDEHAPETDRSVARMLNAARAEFMVDPQMLERWSRALAERVDTLANLVRARADLVLAWLEWQEACGPREEEQP